ncbi:DUF2484 family protein [Tropicimonas sp. IMCC6043]|uniref:DUF2484 family protein n=1 Tax=Tropicimonas sp. IMCC6043 TaxID=2510645 RepID=UPI00101D24C2|nr:DUF2484 family protein [Tropicimonas sp. IMCC6043]RYH07662.1 DUF2484 family protein [Tropicimonas sp. IMCC6043]
MNVLVLGCLWVLVGTATALMPMRYQYLPGFLLLLSAPVLIWKIGVAYGWLPLLLVTAAFASMFRKPLRALALWALGGRGESGP